MPKLRGCAIFQTRVIRQKVSLKIIKFSMEMPCWSPSEGLHMAIGNQWKHLEFTMALSKRLLSLLNLKTFAKALLSTYWLLRTRKHKANWYFRARNMLPRNNADVTHCEKNRVLFSKQSGLQASRYLFKNVFYLIKVKT